MRQKRPPDPESVAYALLSAAGWDTESKGPMDGYKVRIMRGGLPASDWHKDAVALAAAVLGEGEDE